MTYSLTYSCLRGTILRGGARVTQADVIARAKRICIALDCGAPSTIFEVVIEALLSDHQEAKREAIIKEVRRQLARKERK